MSGTGDGSSLANAASVVSPDPVVKWVAPTKDANGNPLVPGNTPNEYLVGLRDTSVAGSAAGTYPSTATVQGGGSASAPCSVLGFKLTRGGTYAVAAESEVGQPPSLQSSWSSEFFFQWNAPFPVPAAPTGVTVS